MDLKKILDEHLLWLNGEGGSRANLSGADLRGANLCDADLRDADLSGANLSCASMDQMIWDMQQDPTAGNCPNCGAELYQNEEMCQKCKEEQNDTV